MFDLTATCMVIFRLTEVIGGYGITGITGITGIIGIIGIIG